MKVVVLEVELNGVQRACLAALAVAGVLGAVRWAGAAPPTAFAAGDTLTAAALNANFDGLHQRMLALEGLGDCPEGYTKDPTPPNPSNPGSVSCTKGEDEIVKVGTGSSAFWIDRYEATIWDSESTPSMQYGVSSDNYPATFPDTGQWTTPLYALSRAGFPPSGRLTWYQMHQACVIVGKQLPSYGQWLAAAYRTVDPGSSTGTGGACVTSGAVNRSTGEGTACRSWAGAEDMVGNLWEVLDQVFGSPPQASSFTANPTPFPASGVSGSFGGDGVWADSFAQTTQGTIFGHPISAMAGGSSADDTRAGVFALNYIDGVIRDHPRVGFRCVTPR